jgi:protein SCO1/2
MRKDVRIKTSRATKKGLTGKERRVVSIGVGAALLLAFFLGLMMFGLQHSSTTSDPDAQTPISKPDYPRRLIDFSLVDQSGRAITRKDLEGKIAVVNFVFTSCATVCPYVNAQMEKIQQLTAGQANVKLISLTMDPADDTPPVLAKYGQDYGEDPRRWSFVTGEEAEMHRLVGTSFLPPDTTGEFAYMPGNFAHTQRIALVDARGHLVEYFDGLNQEAADAVVKAIAKLQKGSP